MTFKYNDKLTQLRSAVQLTELSCAADINRTHLLGVNEPPVHCVTAQRGRVSFYVYFLSGSDDVSFVPDFLKNKQMLKNYFENCTTWSQKSSNCFGPGLLSYIGKLILCILFIFVRFCV